MNRDMVSAVLPDGRMEGGDVLEKREGSKNVVCGSNQQGGKTKTDGEVPKQKGKSEGFRKKWRVKKRKRNPSKKEERECGRLFHKH